MTQGCQKDRAVARNFQWGGRFASESSKLRTRRFAPSPRGGSEVQPQTGSRGGVQTLWAFIILLNVKIRVKQKSRDAISYPIRAITT